MGLKRPDWLPELGPRDETRRAAAGLTPKRDGWYKSVDGKTRYLFKPMPLADALSRLDARLSEVRGQQPRKVSLSPGTLTIEALAEMYLAWLLERVRTGTPKKLARRTYDDNVKTLFQFVDAVGPQRPAHLLGPDDFGRYVRKHLAGVAASSRRRNIIYVDAFLNWAGPGRRRMNLIPQLDPGTDWVKPSDEEVTTAAVDSDKAYTPAEARAAFDAVADSPMLSAAAHLALCGAFGPKDLATLPESVVNLQTGEVRFPRGKTGVGRQCYLTPEAVAAVRRWLDQRGGLCDPAAAGLLFRSRTGLPYARDEVDPDAPGAAGTPYNSIGNQWHKLTGLPLSGLRSTFATIADDWHDQRAVDVVMGHKSGHSIRSKHYAKRVNPERIRQLCEHVWLHAFAQGPPRPARRVDAGAAAPGGAARRPRG
jgi:integrase